LHRGGQNKLVGTCPFHTESTPSFYVFTAGKWVDNYHCFGCGEHGDVINYLMKVNGIDFAETIKLLVEYYNIDTSDLSMKEQNDYLPKAKKPTYTVIAASTVRQTLCQYETNNFVVFLTTYFNDNQLVNELKERYYIGTAKGNKTIFWLIDQSGCARTGQIILYDQITGKRNRKEPIKWTHSSIPNFTMEQCFFGLHLLATEPKSKTIAIVESPKTAVLMSALMRDYIWLASCGKNGLSDSKFEVLADRNIVLYPDLGQFEVKRDGQTISITAFQLWSEQADLLRKQGFKIVVSDVLEQYVKTLSEPLAKDYVSKGYDLADYAIEFDWYKELRKTKKYESYSKEDIDWINLLYGSLEGYETFLREDKIRTLAVEEALEKERANKELKKAMQDLGKENERNVEKENERKRNEVLEKKEFAKHRTDGTTLAMF
jgi:hypothetical protein